MLWKAVQLVVVAAVVLVWGDGSSSTPSSGVAQFCSDDLFGTTCLLNNTKQEVEVVGGPVVATGVASRHPVRIVCPATLIVTNSAVNITMGKAVEKGVTPGPSRASQPALNMTETDQLDLEASSLNTTKTNVTSVHAAPSGPSHGSQPSLDTSVTRVTARLAAASDASHGLYNLLNKIEKDTHSIFVGNGSPKQRNVSELLTLPPPVRECVLNVSVNNSTLHKVKGQFNTAQFENSKIVHLGGVYAGKLSVNHSQVTNISLSGNTVAIHDTEIQLINDLKIKQRLDMLDSVVGRVAAGGLLLHSSGEQHPRQPHMLNYVTVRRMEAESLVVAGTNVRITNVVVDTLFRDAVTVRSGGVLLLANVVMHRCEFFYCLNLERGARLILRNTTIRNRTISKMDLQATSNANMYPLFALVSKDDRPDLEVTFPWYWVIIMAVCGGVAGLVIGSAVMWRQQKHRVSPSSTLTLADLLTHDRLQERGIQDHLTDHTTIPIRRPTLARQDSGLTSSSFASYVPFQTQASAVVESMS